AGVLDAWSLGLGEPVRLSAEHGEGMDELYHILRPIAEEVEAKASVHAPEDDVEVTDETAGEGPRKPTRDKPLQIAVIGRPNAGKSTLINKIVGEERLLTGPEAGITRDAISVTADYLGTPVRIFDTAGMRKRAKVVDKLEKLSVADARRGSCCGAARRLPPARSAGPADRRLRRDRGPGGRRCGEQVGALGGPDEEAEGTARGLRGAPAAAEGRAARNRLCEDWARA